MGLDMYLEGHKFFWTDWKNPEKNIMEDGFQLKRKVLELGYWRKLSRRQTTFYKYISESYRLVRE